MLLRTLYSVTGLGAIVCLMSSPLPAQTVAAAPSHVIVVKLVMRSGSVPFAFEPANATVQRGDTLRFVEDAGVMHNVHFKSHPDGARLGSAASGPYLTNKGQTYSLVIDARFTDGKYEFVCDPHEMLGMHGVLIVETPPK